MSDGREAKRVKRAIREISVEQIEPELVAYEANDGRYCIVADRLQFVRADDQNFEITWDDRIKVALIDRYVRSRPERIHATLDAAIVFVRAQISR